MPVYLVHARLAGEPVSADLSVEQRDVLADLMNSAVAPQLIRAVLERDAGAVEGLLAGLDWQDLAALVVVLAEAAGTGS